MSLGQFFYQPKVVEISVGDRVRWTNIDIPHTVTSGATPNPDGGWGSGTLLMGESYSRVFDSAGTFPYFCTIHPTEMSGTIVVSG